MGNNLSGSNIGNGSNGGSDTIASRKSVDIGGSLTTSNFNADGALIRAGSSPASFNINGDTNAY